MIQLLGIMRRLRDPDTGCAWDIRQNFHTIAPFTVEEAYEVADAIERNDLDDLRDELGDLLFQVVFHAQIATEMGSFTFDDVAQSIVDKMISRHPHVFGDVIYESEEAMKAAWETIKTRERVAKTRQGRAQDAADAHSPVTQGTAATSALDGIARNLPALKRADKIQRRAARVGFDWPGIQPVWQKLDEEIAEVHSALDEGIPGAVEDEIGDLLFTVVNLARHCSIDSEQALRAANAKFEARFRRVERLAEAQATPMSDMTLEQLDELWNRSKAFE